MIFHKNDLSPLLFPKDFGLSGMRIGMIYTWSKELLSILNGGMADLTQTPACVQQMMANLLLDKG